MANTAQAKKRARQNEVQRKHNASQRSMMRTFIKKVITAIDTTEKNVATLAYQQAVSVLDKMASKGLIHKNKAARHKSRLNSKLKSLSLS